MLQSISKRLRTLLLIGSLFLNAILLTAAPVSITEEEVIFNEPPSLLLEGSYEKIDLSFRLIEYKPLSVEEQINKYILEPVSLLRQVAARCAGWQSLTGSSICPIPL